MTQQSNKTSRRVSRKRAISLFAVALIIILFLVIALGVSGQWVLLPFLLLLIVLSAGILYRTRPEYFRVLRKARGEDIYYHRSSSNSMTPAPMRSYMTLDRLSNVDKYSIVMDKSPFTLGTREDMDYKFNDPHVSGLHAIIEYRDDDRLCHITNKSHANGTHLNSRLMRVDESLPLQQNDTLNIAGLMFRVEYLNYYQQDN